MANLNAAASAAILTALKAASQSPHIPEFTSGAIEPVQSAVETSLAPILANATNSEPWYQSRVTWGVIISTLLPLATAFGANLSWFDPNLSATALSAAGAALGGALTLYGRWKARKPIGA